MLEEWFVAQRLEQVPYTHEVTSSSLVRPTKRLNRRFVEVIGFRRSNEGMENMGKRENQEVVGAGELTEGLSG